MENLVSLAIAATIAIAPVQSAAQDANTSFTSEELSFEVPGSEEVRLAGTLTMPQGKGPFPAVVLISGAGPHDRDSTHEGHKPFAVLAEHLSSHGIVVLRYDDRGVGGSNGDLTTASWLDLAADAEAAAHLLASSELVNTDEIGVIGHSQGGIVAPVAAARCDCFDFLVSLAGPSTDFVELTLRQRRQAAIAQGAPEEVVLRTEPVLAQAFAAVEASPDLESAQEAVREVLTDEAMATLGAPPAARDVLVNQIAGETMFIALHNQPQRSLPQVNVPVLALTGTLDSVLDADANLAAFVAALSGNPDVSAIKLEGLNHFFQTALTGEPEEYADLEEDFAPEALSIIAEWIGDRFGGS